MKSINSSEQPTTKSQQQLTLNGTQPISNFKQHISNILEPKNDGKQPKSNSIESKYISEQPTSSQQMRINSLKVR